MSDVRHENDAEYSAKGVPLAGDRAMREGWAITANPYQKSSPDWLDWVADWHGENAACFRSLLEDREVLSWKRRSISPVDRLPTREEARAAAALLIRCNGHDLDVWGADDLLDDAAMEALHTLAR